MNYFIDELLQYKEILLIFEHVHKSHTDFKLVKVVRNVLKRYDLINRIMTLTIDSARNNETMHKKLQTKINEKLKAMMKFNELSRDVTLNVRDMNRIYCLTHVIQLILRELLSYINIKLNNEFFDTK